MNAPALVPIVRRVLRRHGLAAMLDAIAEVLEAAEDASLAHDGIGCAGSG
jgi:hypothetical protein